MANWILSTLLCAAVGGSSDCTLVHFTATWCKPCEQIRPSLERLEQQGWSIRTVDVDRESQLVQQYRIENLPTIVILCRDQEVDRMVGAAPYEQIQQRAARAAARNQSGSPRAERQPNPRSQAIVRGQSPSLGAFPMLASVASELPLQRMGGANGDVDLPADARPIAAPSGARGEISGKSSGASIQHAIERAAAATVRIRVDEANTTAYGTGTIIDVHGVEALILTCGHLFRDMLPNSQISIDLFPGTARETNLPSQLIDFKAEGEDIGLISFRLPHSIQPVPILARGEQLRVGQEVFSFGCDHGDSPTRCDTRIKSINRYIGADNIEIAGAPAVGRSGGGLFDLQGRLIGVCNAADAAGDEGIYASAEVVYSQIERLGMSELFAGQPAGSSSDLQRADSQALLASQGSQSAMQDRAAEDTSPGTASPGTTSPATRSLEWPDQSAAWPPGGAPHGGATNSAPTPPGAPLGTSTSTTSQIICIVRDVGGQANVITIDAPPHQLLQLIQQSAQK